MYKMLITALFIREKTTTTNLRNNSKVYQKNFQINLYSVHLYNIPEMTKLWK